MNELFNTLYEGSAFTFVGLGFDDFDELKEEINDLLNKKEIGTVPSENFFTYKGEDMNDYYDLTGTNRYPDDLTFVSFLLDGLDIGKLSILKMMMNCRWFDDIVDNNSRREREN